MCRHMAYLGPPATLRELLIDPEHGLYRQSWAPRRQRHGTVNADGFGVGWYVAGDPVPARYRRDLPVWADESFADIARVTRSGAVLASVRSATAGTAHGTAAVAPFTADGWLFSHNGRVDGWPSSLAGLAGTLPASALLDLDARVDSALLWALVLHRLRSGLPPASALRSVTGALSAAGVTGRFNFLLTDGMSIAATVAGDTLCYRRDDSSVIVASEPFDDGPGWQDLPDQAVISASPLDLTIQPLTREGIAIS
jgi:gamma-glutamyl hercynylcysteine S-oxide hydrolase